MSLLEAGDERLGGWKRGGWSDLEELDDLVGVLKR